MIKNISVDSLHILFSEKCTLNKNVNKNVNKKIKRKKVVFLEKENDIVIKNIQYYKDEEPLRKRPRSNAIIS